MPTEIIEKIYQYRNLDCSVAHETIRYFPKSFRQRQPDGHGGYIWNLTGCETVLYRLPEITAAIKRGKPIFLCAGEKDCLNAVKLGFEATTCPAGEGNWKDSYTETLRGAIVFIIPDNDQKGQKAALEVAERLWDACEVVKIVRLKFEGKDLTDWIDAGGTTDQLKDLCDVAPIFTPVGYLQEYEDWLKTQNIEQLFKELEYLKTAPVKKAGCVAPLLNRFLFIRDAIEYQIPKKGGVSLAYS